MDITITIASEHEQLMNDAFTSTFGLQSFTPQEKKSFVEKFIKDKIKTIVRRYISAQYSSEAEIFE